MQAEAEQVALLKQQLPQGYKLMKCFSSEGQPCGCWTAQKRRPDKGWVSCKVHSARADQGAEGVLKSIQDAGYGGAVLTQFPIFSVEGKKQSRKQARMSKSKTKKGASTGGQYSKYTWKVDLVLAHSDLPKFAAVEVQGADHNKTRISQRDNVKKRAIESIPGFKFFEMHVCKSNDDSKSKQIAEEIVKHVSTRVCNDCRVYWNVLCATVVYACSEDESHQEEPWIKWPCFELSDLLRSCSLSEFLQRPGPITVPSSHDLALLVLRQRVIPELEVGVQAFAAIASRTAMLGAMIGVERMRSVLRVHRNIHLDVRQSPNIGILEPGVGHGMWRADLP